MGDETVFRVWMSRLDASVLACDCTYTADKPPNPGEIIEVTEPDDGTHRAKVLTVNLDHDAQIVAAEI